MLRQGGKLGNRGLDALIRRKSLGVILPLSEPQAQGIDVRLEHSLQTGRQFAAGGFLNPVAHP